MTSVSVTFKPQLVGSLTSYSFNCSEGMTSHFSQVKKIACWRCRYYLIFNSYLYLKAAIPNCLLQTAPLPLGALAVDRDEEDDESLSLLPSLLSSDCHGLVFFPGDCSQLLLARPTVLFSIQSGEREHTVIQPDNY